MHAFQTRSRDELCSVLQSGERAKYLLFWGNTPRPGAMGPWCLSQWYDSKFRVDGINYPTAEHFMMAAKARLFGDHEAERAVLAAKSPGEAKAIGRKVTGFDEDLWTAKRFEIVVAASCAKFGQDESLRDYLCGSRNRVLVEASPKDQVWGIGLAADSEHARDPHNWNGLNLLGFALMEARSRLDVGD